MSDKEETGEIASSNMDEKGSKDEEVKGSLHARTHNNTAKGSGEKRTPKVVWRLYLGTSGKTKFETSRSQSMSGMRRKNQKQAALRQGRTLSPVAGTVKVKKVKKVKKDRDNDTGYSALASDTESEEEIVSSDEDGSGPS